MSHSNDVATRRALRRVVGPELLSFTEDTTQAIRTLQAGIATITQQFAADSAALHAADGWAQDHVTRAWQAIRDHEARLDAQRDAFADLRYRGFFGRLYWLFTGR